MKALCWHGIHNVSIDNVPEPKLINDRDAIIKITATAICGSDLHLYNGVMPTMKSGDVLQQMPIKNLMMIRVSV